MPATTAPLDVAGSNAHYAAYRAAEWLAAALPLSLQYQLANAAAEMWARAAPSVRSAVEENMRCVLGPAAAPYAVRAAARGAFHSFARYLCEFIGQLNQNPAFIDSRLRIVGREHLDAGFKQGRGVIFCSGHYSNWELGASAVARLGYPITAIVQRHSNARIDALFAARRARAGVRIAHTAHGALSALRSLKRNETIAILGDRPTGGPTIEVQFFGRKTLFPQGPWRLALLSGAALLPAFVRRDTGGYTLEFDEPLKAAEHAGAVLSEQEKMRALAEKWSCCFEKRISAAPEQWAAFYPLWKSS